MIDIGLPEMLVIAVVTLLVVGPKDLPKVIRAMAQGFRRLQGFVGEFKAGVNEFLRETELEEFRESINKTKAAMTAPGQLDDYLDPDGSLRRELYGDVDSGTKSPGKGDVGEGSPDEGSNAVEEKPSPGEDTSRKES